MKNIIKKSILIKIFTIILLIFSFIIELKAQNYIIKGIVKDENTAQILPFANVIAENEAKINVTTSTDFEGKFTFKLTAPGKYKVRVTYVGYTPSEIRSINIKDGDTIVLVFNLKENNQTLNSVVAMSTGNSDRRYNKSTSKYKKAGYDGKKAEVKSYKNNRYLNEPGEALPAKDLKKFDVEENINGKLTASELNDFSKWDLWQDMERKELKNYQELWQISPIKRYSVQVKTNEDRAVVDANVSLRNVDGTIIWTSRTDNTGKTELWQDLFTESKFKNLELVVKYENKEYKYEKPSLFKDGINVFKLPVSCNIPNEVDIAFVVDATGSMDDEIAFLKSDLIDIIHKTKQNFPELSLNLGSVFYRCFGNSYVTKHSPLTDNIDNTINFISKQNSGEGGDEVVEEAFQSAVDSLNWSKNARARIIFFVLDQQPLTNKDVVAKMQLYTKKAAEKGIKVIPIIASAETPSTAQSLEYIMRSLALSTNGNYVFLTDHSHIGNEHAKPTTDQYDVELLNSILTRIIYQNCFIPKCNEALKREEKSDTTYITNRKIIAHEIIDTTRQIKHVDTKINVKVFPSNTPNDSINNIKENNNENNENNTSANTNDKHTTKKIELKFFPNPTTGKITVEFEGKINELFLTDISGKLISKYKAIKDSRLEIDLSNYSTGIYFLKFNDNSVWYSGKVILTH